MVNKTALSLTCLALMLTGCASVQPLPKTLTVTKTVYVPWSWPAALQSCAPDPAPLPIPHIVASNPHAGSEVATYIAKLRAHDAQAVGVADDCRNTLAAAIAANKGAQ